MAAAALMSGITATASAAYQLGVDSAAASNQLAASTGAYGEELAALQSVVDGVYANNFGAVSYTHLDVYKRQLHDILSSREYARAFAAALRRGDRPRRDGVNDQNRILYDALTIAGGSPAGEDGGYLVPEDMDTSIREQMRAMQPLSAFVNVETVGSNTGWRVVDTCLLYPSRCV